MLNCNSFFSLWISWKLKRFARPQGWILISLLGRLKKVDCFWWRMHIGLLMTICMVLRWVLQAPIHRGRDIWRVLGLHRSPPKVLYFGWRLATNTLATWSNKMKRNMDVLCNLFDMRFGGGRYFPCLLLCPNARQLWNFLLVDWPLPTLNSISVSGDDWFSLPLWSSWRDESSCFTVVLEDVVR